MSDLVNHPAHYEEQSIRLEPIDYVALSKKRSKREVQDMLLDYLRNKGDKR